MCSHDDALFQSRRLFFGLISVRDFTAVDPYALVFYGWATRSGHPVKDLKAYTAWQERMMNRPTVKKSVESEEKVSAS